MDIAMGSELNGSHMVAPGSLEAMLWSYFLPTSLMLASAQQHNSLNTWVSGLQGELQC